MRMFVTGIDLQLLEYLSAKTVMGKHALDSMFHHMLRTALEEVSDRFEARTAGVKRVVIELFQLLTLARDHNFFGIDHHDIIADVEVRRELRLVLAPENMGDLGCDATQCLTRGVDQIPLLVYFLGFKEVRSWRRLHFKTPENRSDEWIKPLNVVKRREKVNKGRWEMINGGVRSEKEEVRELEAS